MGVPGGERIVRGGRRPARWLLPLLALLPLRCAGTPGRVAAPEPIAAREGARVLGEGGNAADAAVCIGFVLAVTHPEAGNLGGGGFVLVRQGGRDEVIDARETAPAAASREMYLDARGEVDARASRVGLRAAAVPGSVAGYLALLERFGTMDRRRLLAPAIRLAEEGFPVDPGLRRSLERARPLLSSCPGSARIFLAGGPRLAQPELAATLRAVAERGADGFYRGPFAEALARSGAPISRADLEGYRVRIREPLRGRFRGFEVVTTPPPSSGGIALLQILSMLEREDLAALPPPQRLHLFAEASRRAFADRAEHLGDPDFVPVPVARLLDPGYLARRRATIDRRHAGLRESPETCHFSVLDRWDTAVACTTTLNGAYGCGVAVAGVLLNNEMDDFTAKPGFPNQFGLLQSARNAIEPGKRPLSSMAPTILLENGRPALVLGSPGGPTIISTVAQVILNRVALGMPLEAAVAAPRIHHQWMPDEILYEALTADEEKALRALGHRLRRKEGPMGDVQAVGPGIAVSDPRGRGACR